MFWVVSFLLFDLFEEMNLIHSDNVTMMTYRDDSRAPDSGDVTTWLYDEARGSMTNKVYADGKGPIYTYTIDGKLSQRIWARGIATDYTYDNWGNLTNTVYSDGTPTISLFYDSLGRQIKANDAAGMTTFLYDSFGSLTNETVIGVAGTNIIERYYDNLGRNAGYALNGVRQSTLAYDPVTGRLLTMLANGSDTPFTWNYLDGSDLKSSLAYPNGLTASWQYDSNNQLLQVRNATSTNVISQYDYTYDVAGRRVQIGRSGSAMSENRVDEYAYNIRGELISAAKNTEDAKIIEYQYQYDDIGNRITSFDLGTNRTYVANNLNQYTSISNSAISPLLGHPLRGQPSAGGYSSPREEFIPQFDDDGNQTLIKTATGIWRVQYNGENRPILWENVSTNSPTHNSSTPTLISMSYDRQGRRVTKNDQRFVYDGYLQIADNNGNVYIWDPTEKVATRPLVWNCEVSADYYVHDGNKNMSEVVASSGEISAHYDYSPFGKAIQPQQEDRNPWQFSSEYVDRMTDVVYYNYRYYGSLFGRWNERDPLEEFESVNVYEFNNPISTTDTLGLKKCRSNSPRPGYEPSVNGCGTEGGFPVPDSYFGMVDFTACCNGHDRCYGTCGSNRADCDSALSDCMKNACDKYFTLPIAWHERVACRATASIYWLTLRAIGGAAYESAQDESCDEEECCDDK